MATSTPPRTPARLPDYAPRRGQRRHERLRALAAVLLLVVLVVGVPVALVLGVGTPSQLSLPDRSWITSQASSDTTTILQIFSLVVWLAWAHFVLCLISERRLERRGAPSPSRVLLGGGSQRLARRLVASVLLIGGAATLVNQGHGAPCGRSRGPAGSDGAGPVRG